jgi:hypothetical protein
MLTSKELKSVCLYLGKKSKTAQEIFDEMNDVLGKGTIAYSTVKRHLRSAESGGIPCDDGVSKCPDIVDESIQKALAEGKFTSIRNLARASGFPASTVYYHVTRRLGLNLQHLRWSVQTEEMTVRAP